MKSLYKAPSSVLFIITLVFLVVSASILGSFIYSAVRHQKLAASTVPCQVSGKLVNECRPWFGATSYGYPQVAKDSFTQFKYFEQRIGRQVDILHDYSGVGAVPFTSAQRSYLDSRPNGIVYANWKPASKWKDAAGGNAGVNARIDQAAANIKAASPHKVFLTIHAEPENDVTPGTSSCGGLKGSFGSPADYRAMWQNVRKRFDAKGVKNVVWVMNYMGYSGWDCLVSQMWPGNSVVDWITYDQYGFKNETADQVIGRFYHVLEQKTDASHNYTSKPWGMAEFSAYDMTQSQAYAFYDSMARAVQSNKYPRMKMYLVFDHTNPDAYLRIAYSKAGKYDPEEQRHFNQFANSPIFLTNTKQVVNPVPAPNDSDGDGIADPNDQCPTNKGQAPTGCPAPTPTPAPTVPQEDPNQAYTGDNPDYSSLEDIPSDNVPVDGEPEVVLDHDEYNDLVDTGNDDSDILQNTPSVVLPDEPGQNPTVTGDVEVINPSGAEESVVKANGTTVAKGEQTTTIDTTCLRNGTQVISVSNTDGSGKRTQTVEVRNRSSAWQNFRNEFCSQLGGNKRAANVIAGTFVGAPALGLVTLGWVGWRWFRLRSMN